MTEIVFHKRRGRPPKPRGKRGSADTARLSRAARQAAWKRLAQLQPDLYDILYTDERHKRGLMPVPKRVAEGSYAAKVDELVYSADVKPGVMDAEPHRQST